MFLFDYAYCRGLNSKLAALAMLSPERWSFTGQNNFGILRNYLNYTFARLQEERKVFEATDYSLFNTGLLDKYYEPIYSYFIPNTATGTQKWELSGFYTAYQLVSLFKVYEKPLCANYFDNPADLVFDNRLELVVQYDHIFGDPENIERLPPDLRNNGMIKQLFDGAVNTAKVRIGANYKIAVPQYYRGKLQLLIPICLHTPEIADLALACEKADDKYLGRTCLTLDMAYNNARLIAKPDGDWLHP